MADLGAQRSVKPTVTVTKFGDGYEQRQASGINYLPKSWSVTFTNPGPMTKEILAFLETRGGVEAFSWLDPMGDTANYVCREWSSSRQSKTGVYQISGTFEQVYEY
jgi:phage-related protein